LQIGPLSQAAPGPLYQQIVDGIRREISAGHLHPGTLLPSFRVLAEDLLVSLITVKRAYEELERLGIIYRRQGLGTFVAHQGQEKSQAALYKNTQQLLSKAAQGAREAGLSRDEFIDMAGKAALLNKEGKT
jgi:GntR family transcriptional regulator